MTQGQTKRRRRRRNGETLGNPKEVRTDGEIVVYVVRSEGPMNPVEEQKYREILADRFGYRFIFDFSDPRSIDRGKNCKFEDFICRIC